MDMILLRIRDYKIVISEITDHKTQIIDSIAKSMSLFLAGKENLASSSPPHINLPQ